MNQKFNDWVDEQHQLVGQLYAGRAYSFHTNEVVEIAEHFSYLLSSEREKLIVQVAAKGHNIIEDTNNNYNDIVLVLEECDFPYSVEASDVIYDVSNELGKNRKERAEKTYPKTAKTLLTVFVKLCDRIGNVSQSLRETSTMFDKYLREQKEFRNQLDKYPELKPMWDRLQQLLDKQIQPESR